VTAQDLTVDGEGNLGDLGIGGAAVLLARELNHGVGSVVQQPFESAHLALRVLSYRFRDVDVLALDDRPHG
jgi:hypothetical protein